MKGSVAGTSLKESEKTFTNHCARKTTVSKLKKAKIVSSEYMHRVVFQLYLGTCAGTILFWARALFVYLFNWRVHLAVHLVVFSTFSRALRIIFPDLGYQEVLKECNIATLHQRRQWLTERLFNEIKDNSLHKLHGLLPPRNLSTVALRRKRAFNVPLCRTNRLMNSFIMHNAAIF